MSVQKISNAILGVGVDDTTIDLFESQYPVPTGVSYNSYVILDEKVAILDTVDNRATDAWLANLTEALGDRMPEYLVVSHMEPDHGANIARLAAKYPDMKVVGNAKTFVYMEQFFGPDALCLHPWCTGRRSWSAMRAAKRCCSPPTVSAASGRWQSLTKRLTGPAKPAGIT